jgi:Lar family restriction alleviation protein
MTTTDALLPCPFCGSDIVGFRHRGLPDTQAGCNDCGTSGAWHGNRTQAIAAWNRRPIYEQPRANGKAKSAANLNREQ